MVDVGYFHKPSGRTLLNMLFVTDKQQRKAAARHMLPAGQRRR
jgi:hypothetical protein